jgi:Tol biopolymer transport system component
MKTTTIVSTNLAGGIRRASKQGVHYQTAHVAPRLRRSLSAALAATLAVMLVALPQRPVKADSCSIAQITSSPDPNFFVSTIPSINADGTRIAFGSNADLTGGNADFSREIFLYDAAVNGFLQITSSTVGESRFPSINADGTRIAFYSTSDLTGGNPFENREFFLFDTTTLTFTQITSGGGTGGNIDTLRPVINAAGTRIAFISRANLTGGNADGSAEIFLFDTTTNNLTQLTSSATGSAVVPSISADGTRIGFSSTADLTGGNADGNFEIFLFDTSTNSATQITHSTVAGSAEASISADGTRIAFGSFTDLIGSNPDGNEEIFLFDTTTNSLTQITSSEAFIGSRIPTIYPDGSRIAFRSFADFTGGNADGSEEVFVYDIAANTFTQLTSSVTGGGPSVVSINADGTRIAFASGADLTGGNPDLSTEIFVATCTPGPPDGDGDGIPDDSDPDTIADVVVTLPPSAFQAGGNQNAVLSRLNDIAQDILAGDIAGAIKKLENLRKRVDGCGAMADNNDWIKDCAAQIQIRALIDMLIANLSA